MHGAQDALGDEAGFLVELADGGGDEVGVGGVDAAAGDFPEERPAVVGGAAEEQDLAARVGDEGARDHGVDLGGGGEEGWDGGKEGGEVRVDGVVCWRGGHFGVVRLRSSKLSCGLKQNNIGCIGVLILFFVVVRIKYGIGCM